MRNRIWNFISDVKFKSLYLDKCHSQADQYSRAVSLLIAFSSAGSIAAWSAWKQVPEVWGMVIAVSQFLIIAKPYLPFLKNAAEFREMAFEYESLYVNLERLWYLNEGGDAENKAIEKQYYDYREQAINIERKRSSVVCPTVKAWVKDADLETDRALRINFGLREAHA